MPAGPIAQMIPFREAAMNPRPQGAPEICTRRRGTCRCERRRRRRAGGEPLFRPPHRSAARGRALEIRKKKLGEDHPLVSQADDGSPCCYRGLRSLSWRWS